jgi:glycosyltransferase involved in cell wall biosynthesis
MRIAFDARLVTYRRGIGNFVFHLIQQYAHLAPEYEFILYVDSERAYSNIPKCPHCRVRQLGHLPYPIWEQVLLPIALHYDRPDILHCPANTGPLWIPPGIRLVQTINDVIYLLPTHVLSTSPTLYHRLGREYRRLVAPRVAQQAKAIITISAYSRQDILKYLEVPESKLHVILGAPNSACRVMKEKAALAAVRTKYSLDAPFVLALGAIDPRKNTARIIKAYARFRQQSPGRYQLALIGLPPAGIVRFQRLAKSLKVADDVVLASFVPEDDLVGLYNAAEMLVYPSLYEGFGLPVLEAMACGTPVIASPSGSIPEVAGDAALLIDPNDPDALARAMIQVALDNRLRQRLIELGFEQARKFSWEKAAMETLNIYKECMRQ